MNTMIGVSDPIYASAGIPPNALLDRNLRFLGGLWLVLGVATYWLIPRIAAGRARAQDKVLRELGTSAWADAERRLARLLQVAVEKRRLRRDRRRILMRAR